MCIAGVALVALGVMCILCPGTTLLSLAWVFGLMFFFGGCTEKAAWSATRGFIPMSGLMLQDLLSQTDDQVRDYIAHRKSEVIRMVKKILKP